MGEQQGADNHILYWRKQKRLSLRTLSVRLSTVSSEYASPNTINRWEKGETPLPQWAVTGLAQAFKITAEDLLHGPREADPVLPVNMSAAYTGLDMEIAESLINLGYTSWLASRPDEARLAVRQLMPWLNVMQRRAIRPAQASQGRHIQSRAHETAWRACPRSTR